MILYKDPTQPIDARVQDLISRMTVKEKTGQLNQKMVGDSSDNILFETVVVIEE